MVSLHNILCFCLLAGRPIVRNVGFKLRLNITFITSCYSLLLPSHSPCTWSGIVHEEGFSSFLKSLVMVLGRPGSFLFCFFFFCSFLMTLKVNGGVL